MHHAGEGSIIDGDASGLDLPANGDGFPRQLPAITVALQAKIAVVRHGDGLFHIVSNGMTGSSGPKVSSCMIFMSLRHTGEDSRRAPEPTAFR